MDNSQSVLPTQSQLKSSENSALSSKSHPDSQHSSRRFSLLKLLFTFSVLKAVSKAVAAFRLFRILFRPPLSYMGPRIPNKEWRSWFFNFFRSPLSYSPSEIPYKEWQSWFMSFFRSLLSFSPPEIPYLRIGETGLRSTVAVQRCDWMDE